jgi:hypothetical protein
MSFLPSSSTFFHPSASSFLTQAVVACSVIAVAHFRKGVREPVGKAGRRVE